MKTISIVFALLATFSIGMAATTKKANRTAIEGSYMAKLVTSKSSGSKPIGEARVIMVDAKTAILTWSLSGSVENVYKADLLNSGSASGAAPLVTAFHSTPFSVKGKFTSEISFNPSNITSLLAGNMAAIEVLTTTETIRATFAPVQKARLVGGYVFLDQSFEFPIDASGVMIKCRIVCDMSWTNAGCDVHANDLKGKPFLYQPDVRQILANIIGAPELIMKELTALFAPWGK